MRKHYFGDHPARTTAHGCGKALLPITTLLAKSFLRRLGPQPHPVADFVLDLGEARMTQLSIANGAPT